MDQIQFFHPEFISKKTEFETIYTLRFSKPEGLDFVAGQWVHLGVNTPEPDKSMVRHMSFSSSPDEEFIEFSMDLGSGSNYKNALAALQPGDKVKAFKIRGEFTVDPDERRKVVFLCGGLGITPVRAIIKKLAALNSTVDWTLVHVARSGFLFADELKHYAGKQLHVNRQELENVWPGLIADADHSLFYICGSARFLDGITERLLEAAVEDTQIKTESFK